VKHVHVIFEMHGKMFENLLSRIQGNQQQKHGLVLGWE